MRTVRSIICLSVLAACAFAAPGVADASSTQMTLMQDDRELFGERGENPAAAMAEMKELGVDVLRTNVLFYRTYSAAGANHTDRRKPSDFSTSDPNEDRYDWSKTDNIVNLAKANGIKLLFTISGPGPRWASEQPNRCQRRGVCTWKPKAKEFGAFTAAVAKRYRGQVDYYALYNEPNLYTWITPEVTRTRAGLIETAAIYYRNLWRQGYKAIVRNDPRARRRVLFGEVAAIGKPLSLISAALCLGTDGKPFRSARLRRAYKCTGRFRRLPVGGVAIHPYNQGAFGTPRSRTRTKEALPQAYLPRLHRLTDRAIRRGRIGRAARNVYITEFGYQTNPPDGLSNVSPREHAQYINESDRLFFSDRRVKTVGQYELVDVPEEHEFNSGLRFAGASRELKPAYEAYRTPIVVTRRSSRSVEVYGQVRPQRLFGSRPVVQIQVQSGGTFTTVRTATGNSRGIFRRNISRGGAASARWRLVWQDPRTGEIRISRVARAGKRLKYYRN